MKKFIYIYYVIVGISSSSLCTEVPLYNPAQSYLISNGGQAGSGWIAVYDHKTLKSVLLNGYKDQHNDNGQCALGGVFGQKITILIPENPSKFGYIDANCVASSDGSIAYKQQCLSYCGGPIQDGTSISVNPPIIDYQGCSVTQSDGATLINDPTYGTIYCPQKSKETIHVTPVCQQLGSYFENNFADNGGVLLSEFVQCAPDDISYCSITFTPKQGFKVRINTDYLTSINHSVPGSCSAEQTCSFLMKDGSINRCQVNIQDPSYGSGLSALNKWVARNSSSLINPQPFQSIPPLPRAYFSNCSGLSETANVSLESAHFDTAEDLLNAALNRNRIFFKSEIQRFKSLYQKTANEVYNTRANNLIKDSIKQEITLRKEDSSLFGSYIQAQQNNNFSCQGQYILDSNNSIKITYTCSTLLPDGQPAYEPSYTCQYIYEVPYDAQNQSYGNAQIKTGYCNFPLEEIVMQNPALGQPDFNCGFCNTGGTTSVGFSKEGPSIESGAYGLSGSESGQNSAWIYPFKTNQSDSNPSCSSGFISQLYNPPTENQGLTVFNTLFEPVVVLYNQVWGNVGYPQITFGGGLKTVALDKLSQVNAPHGPIYPGNIAIKWWNNATFVGKCSTNAPGATADASCIGLNVGQIRNFNGLKLFGISKSITNDLLGYMKDNSDKVLTCSPSQPSCAYIGTEAEELQQVQQKLPSYVISNGGQNNAGGVVAVYDSSTENSVILEGYNGIDNDNAHCVQGNISGNELTIIIQEDLWTPGYLNDRCSKNSKENPDPSCLLFTDGVVREGDVIKESSSVVNLAGCSSSYQPNMKQISVGNQKWYCPQTTSFDRLHVSPLCQAIGSYIKNQFASQEGGVFQITEYASGDKTKPSYCSVTFTPAQEINGFKMRVNTQFFNGTTSLITCSGETCIIQPESEKTQQKWNFSLSIPALNAWYAQNSQQLSEDSIPAATFSFGSAVKNCYAAYSQSEQGDTFVAYTCPTDKPDINCTFSYQLNKGETQFAQSGSYCTFPIDNTVIQKTTNGAIDDFTCGFCGGAEWKTVGNNSTYNNIESLGSTGELYPFSTAGASNPTCLNGFISKLNPESVYNNIGEGYTSNGIFSYNFSGIPFLINIAFNESTILSNLILSQEACQLTYTGGDIITALAFNNHPSSQIATELSSVVMLNNQGWAYASASLSASKQYNPRQPSGEPNLYVVHIPGGKSYQLLETNEVFLVNDVTKSLSIPWGSSLQDMRSIPACQNNKLII